ncbi:MAG: 4-alpha-glucanotransferase [Elusimicrobiaceae bacterium]|nr:4-alpha-glucanotransferase [Elusimicrobiaceae bacterium]
MALNLHENKFINSRLTGVLLPLSSMRSNEDWGCGDLASLKSWLTFFSKQGLKVLQILPINETAPNENCPYSALSTYAIDPLYLSINDIPEYKKCQKAREVVKELQADIEEWRKSKNTKFIQIKAAKYRVLWETYLYFLQEEKLNATTRYQEFLEFEKKNFAWLVPYAIFRAAKDLNAWQSWLSWQEDLKNPNIKFLQTFTKDNYQKVMFFVYIQWLLQAQMREAKKVAKENDIALCGDIPFGVNFESADVWGNQKRYNLDAEIGAPQDQFSQGGQKWGLPAYNWTDIAQNNFNFWRNKIAKACEIYDIFRLDHMVGFFRTWIFEKGQDKGHFDIENEEEQKKRGFDFLQAVFETAKEKLPIAEDLGVIPDYMRQMMQELSMPGYKVLRWEKDNEVFREPRNYQKASVATTGTHDTETLKEWWQQMPAWQRANFWEMVSAKKTDGNVAWSKEVHKEILKRTLGSASCLVILPFQDILGEEGRINTPGTVNEENWTYRTPFEPEQISKEYQESFDTLKDLMRETERL